MDKIIIQQLVTSDTTETSNNMEPSFSSKKFKFFYSLTTQTEGPTQITPAYTPTWDDEIPYYCT